MAWYENDGSGDFTEHTITTRADGAEAVGSADIDGDGDIDALSASWRDDTVAWYENDGTGTFTAHAITANASGAEAVESADIDGDGDPDVLSASQKDDTIAWYENDGSGSFTTHTITTSADSPEAVASADLDGDGDVDALSASENDDTVGWYENDGTGTFTNHTITTTADGAWSVSSGDLDGDGDLDVLSASAADDTVAWYENDGTGTFTSHTLTTHADGANAVDSTDVDGDGDLDVLSASRNDDTVAWYENDGTGTFTTHTIATDADGAWSVTSGDLDDDGDWDVLSASRNDDTVAWYENLISKVWPQFGLNDERTSVKGWAGGGTGQEVWNFSTGAAVQSSPAVANGTVYVGSGDTRLYALDATTGIEKWRFNTSDKVQSSPAVWNGTVYMGSRDSKVYAVDAETGAKEWSFQTNDDVQTSSPAVWNGTVYIGSWDTNLYALDAETGEKQWQFSTGGEIRSSPLVWNGTVYFSSQDSNVYAVDAETGTEEWRFETPWKIRSSPAIWNGTVYFGDRREQKVYALDAETGTQEWTFTTGNAIRSTPAVWNGTVYVGSKDSYLYALDADTGTQEWRFQAGDWVRSSPAVANGTVYFGADDNHVYALDADTGTEEWRFETDDDVFSSPAVANGVLYVGSGRPANSVDETRVYALDAGTLPTPSPPQNFTAEAGPHTRTSALDWDPPADNGSSPLDHYRAYRGTSSSDLSLVASTSTTNYTDSDLACDQTYYYEVTAVNKDGLEGAPSETKSATPVCMDEVLEHFAPVFYHDTIDEPRFRGHENSQDEFTRFNYDGDTVATNNWEHEPDYPHPSWVYTKGQETETHFFLSYQVYHPRDWDCEGGEGCTWESSLLPLSEHENDGEAALVQVRKDDSRLGRLQAVHTAAHGDYNTYTAPGSSVHSVDCLFVGDCELKLWTADGGEHPKLGIEAGGHGIYNFPNDHVWNESANDFKGKTGNIYYPAGVASAPSSDSNMTPGVEGGIAEPSGYDSSEAPCPTAFENAPWNSSDQERGNDRCVRYGLTSVDSLWELRYDFTGEWGNCANDSGGPCPYADSYGTFRGDDGGSCGGVIWDKRDCTENAADITWGYPRASNEGYTGQWFENPAAFSQELLDGEGMEGDSYLETYLGRTPGGVAESYHPHHNLADRTWTFKRPGVSQLAVHFERFDLGDDGDRLQVSTSADTWEASVEQNEDTWTSCLDGDTVTIQLRTDGAEQGWGFYADKVSAKHCS